MSDLVIDEIRDRGPHTPVKPEGMEGRGQLQLHTFGPNRIVVEFAVETQIIHPREISGEFGRLPRKCWNWPAHKGSHHYDLQTQPSHIFEFFKRLMWRMHRNTCCRRQSVGIVV